MKRSVRPKRHGIGDVVCNAVVILFAALNLFPFYWMITCSFKTSAGIFKMPPDWWPKSLYLKNYSDLFSGQPALLWTGNSIFVAGVSTVLLVTIASLAAYSFSKLSFRGRGFLYAVFIGSLMIPKEIFIVPLFKIVLKLNWSDTYSGMIFPGLATAYGVFMLKGFFDSVPDSIRESGKLDGASELTVFSKLILPIVKPGIGALFILFFVNVWNDYMWQMLMARSKDMMTLMVGTASIMLELVPKQAYQMAGATVACLPMLFIFLVFQRFFTRGITIGAEKG